MASQSFVRREMLPQQAPPPGVAGPLNWIRENLFPGPVSAAQTVIFTGLAVWLVIWAFPWFWFSEWSAPNLRICRELLGDSGGACFAFVTERWHQFLFGPTFPAAERWRMVVAFVLLIIALAPLLYPMLPRKMMWISAAYPFLMIWLVWGGTLWGPILAAVGFVLGALAFRLTVRFGTLTAVLAAIAASVIWWNALSGSDRWAMTQVGIVTTFADAVIGSFSQLPLRLYAIVVDGSWSERLSLLLAPVAAVFVYLVLRSRGVVLATGLALLAAGVTLVYLGGGFAFLYFFGGLDTWLDGKIPMSLPVIQSRNLGGLSIALIIGLSGILLSLPLGVLLALGRQSNLLIIHTVSVGFIEFIRGVPLITILIAAQSVLGYFLPPETEFDIVLRVVILVTLFSAAYNAETIRGGLAALPKGQTEAAQALGMNYWTAQRLIILPQALKISIPGIVNNFIGLFKDTTLVSIIGIYDLLGLFNILDASTDWKGLYWEFYFVIGLMFFIICFSMSRYSLWLEKRLRTDVR